MENMLEEVNWCKSKMKKHFNKPLKMTMENEIDFKKAIKCHICDQQYTDKDTTVILLVNFVDQLIKIVI